ncbi:hypothetical protein GCM10007937_53770 [Mesorhizobium albiziae]|nr:hypothetical protein GCM10007937_53770 [Mesorhizobium albiziae]
MNADASAQRMHTRIGAIVTGWGDDEVARAKLDANTKELSGLTVSLQVSHLFSPPSRRHGGGDQASRRKAAIVRHRSSMQVDLATFKKQTGAMLGGTDQAMNGENLAAIRCRPARARRERPQGG